MSVRAANEGPHEIYTFSLHPLRLVEFLWPNVYGTPFHGNRYWVDMLPSAGQTVKIWAPTLYLGGITLVLALSAALCRHRQDGPWKTWLVGMALLSLLASFGDFMGPLRWARLRPADRGADRAARSGAGRPHPKR